MKLTNKSSKKDKMFNKIIEFIVKPQTVLVLVMLSIMISLLHMHVANYGLVNGSNAEHLAILRGESDKFTEANNGGQDIIPFFAGKLLNLDDFSARILVTIPIFCLIFFLLYKMTQSQLVTIMPLMYPPLIVDSYLVDTAFVIICLLLTIYFYKNNQKNEAFFWSIPLALYRHEGIVLYAALFLHEIIKQKEYTSIEKVLAYLNTIKIRILFLITSITLYLYLQFFFFKNPFANFILNSTESIALNFPWYYGAIRWILVILMLITSFMLYPKSKFLFWTNTALATVYIAFGVLGFDYTFYAILKYYSWMFIFTIFAIALHTKILDSKKWDV